jgi:hypothetical protein
LFLCLLGISEYREILEMTDTIEKKDDYLDCTEKQLRMMGLLAREKFKIEDSQGFQRYMQIKKEQAFLKEQHNNTVPSATFTPTKHH